VYQRLVATVMTTVWLCDLCLQAGTVSAAALPPAKRRRMDGIAEAAGATEQPALPPGHGVSPETPAAGTTGKLSFSLGGASALQVSCHCRLQVKGVARFHLEHMIKIRTGRTRTVSLRRLASSFIAVCAVARI